MTKAHLRLLRENYENACNSYLLALANMWEWDCSGNYGFWIGDDVGGIHSYGDCTFINMEDIVYCVENSISEKTYDEWQEYCLWAKDFEQVVPNLKSWCMGCPRVDEATQEKLTAMRNELNKLIDETKAKF